MRTVLDMIPLGPELPQQLLIDLAVVPDGVLGAAGLGDPPPRGSN